MVLLVDDGPDDLTPLTVWLQTMGHQVHTATSANEALQVLDDHGYPGMDIVMEHTTGLDLVDHLRHHHPASAHMPSMLLSARHLSSHQATALALNAHLMIKPLDRAG
jgi:CheY-like chemotaxis protein